MVPIRNTEYLVLRPGQYRGDIRQVHCFRKKPSPDQTEIYVYNKSDLLAGTANPASVHLVAAESVVYAGVEEQTYSSNGYLVSTFQGTDTWIATISGTPAANDVALSETDLGALGNSAPVAPAIPNGFLGGGQLDGRVYSAVFEVESSDNKPIIEYSTGDQCNSPQSDCIVDARIDLSGPTPVQVNNFTSGQSGWDYTYGAVGLNAAGQVFQAYSRSNASTPPESAVLGPGFDSVIQTATPGSSACGTTDVAPCTERWGDYLGTAIDPSDPSSVWVTGLYQTTNGPFGSGGYGWGTVMAKVAALPTVTNVNPASGPTAGGTSVTISGANFTGASAVTFGANSATSFTVNNSSQITATAPPGSAGTVDVTVMTPAGTSATSSADHYTYSTSSPATISAVGALANKSGNNTKTLSVSPQHAGDLEVLAVKVSSSSVSATSVTGGGVSTWTQAAHVTEGGNQLQIFTGPVTSTGSSTLTVNYSASVTSIYTGLAAREFSSSAGASTTWTTDAAAGIANASSTTVTFPKLSPAASGELYFGYAAVANSGSAGTTLTKSEVCDIRFACRNLFPARRKSAGCGVAV